MKRMDRSTAKRGSVRHLLWRQHTIAFEVLAAGRVFAHACASGAGVNLRPSQARQLAAEIVELADDAEQLESPKLRLVETPRYHDDRP